eukprot:gene21420-31998_t
MEVTYKTFVSFGTLFNSHRVGCSRLNAKLKGWCNVGSASMWYYDYF